MRRCFAIWLPVLLTACAHAPPSAPDATRAALERHARAAALTPLADSASAPELRVWSDAAMSCYANGWRLTQHTLRRYRMPVDPRGYPDAPCPSAYSLASSTAIEQWPAALDDLLPRLAALDGHRIECGAKGPSSYVVEGEYRGRRFAFLAFNPGKCEGVEAAEVSRLLGLLDELAP